MKLTGEQARAVVTDDLMSVKDSEQWEWERVTGNTIVDNTRWSICYSAIFKYKQSARTYRFYWKQGATEMQDEQPYEYDDFYEPKEVVEKPITTTEWVDV